MRAGQAVRVVVADDQTVVREGIAMLLGLLPGLEVVGSASDGEEAVRLVAEVSPDVVLMDLRMPRCDGVEATRRIRRDYPETQVVVLTTFADDDSLFPALRAGARGYLTKDAGSEQILKAIEDVIAGAAGLSPQVQRRLLERLCESAEPADLPGPAAERPGRRPAEPLRLGRAATGDGGTDEPGGASGDHGAGRESWDGRGVERAGDADGGAAALPDGLTAREVEVLALVAEGLSNAEIAERLFVSLATVKTHINNIFAKSGVRDRAQAVRYAYRYRIGLPGDDDRA